jgi:hypothetical protein
MYESSIEKPTHASRRLDLLAESRRLDSSEFNFLDDPSQIPESATRFSVIPRVMEGKISSSKIVSLSSVIPISYAYRINLSFVVNVVSPKDPLDSSQSTLETVGIFVGMP